MHVGPGAPPIVVGNLGSIATVGYLLLYWYHGSSWLRGPIVAGNFGSIATVSNLHFVGTGVVPNTALAGLGSLDPWRLDP